MSSVESEFKALLSSVNEKLLTVGFRKRRTTFRLIRNGNCALIEFQRSVDSTPFDIKFTVNLAIVVGSLLDSAVEPTKVGSTGAHLRRRIGFVDGHDQDHWWHLGLSNSPAKVRAEVIESVYNYGVPYVMTYIDTLKLIELWKAGESPGLTDVQRMRYLDAIYHHTGER